MRNDSVGGDSETTGAAIASRLPMLTTVLTTGLLVVVFCIPSSRAATLEFLELMVALDAEGLRDAAAARGDTAWLITSALMILQALAAPVPAIAITFTNALIYGPWLGALISWSSAQLAAVICFFIARALGRPFVARLFSERALLRFDQFFERHGAMTILVARLLPVVSFDIISYAAGVTKTRLGVFFIATGLGQLPATLIYSHVGAQLLERPSALAFAGLWMLAGLAAAAWWIRSRRESPDSPDAS